MCHIANYHYNNDFLLKIFERPFDNKEDGIFFLKVLTGKIKLSKKRDRPEFERFKRIAESLSHGYAVEIVEIVLYHKKDMEPDMSSIGLVVRCSNFKHYDYKLPDGLYEIYQYDSDTKMHTLVSHDTQAISQPIKLGPKMRSKMVEYVSKVVIDIFFKNIFRRKPSTSRHLG